MATVTRNQPPLEALASIAPLIREHAEESERQATIAAPIVEAIRETGLFQSLVPAGLGGSELDPLEWFRVVEAGARIHGSTGWILMINGGCGVVGQFMDDATAAAVFGNGGVVAGGVFPLGKAVATKGGYLVDGRWPFASGCKHSSFLMAGCIAHDGATPRMAHGGPDVRLMCVPASDARIIDTWAVSGLSATGSHDLLMENRFVPEAFAVSLFGPRTNSYYQGALYRVPFMVTFGFPIAAVALGIAQQSIDVALDLAMSKVPVGAQTALKDRALFQMQLAEATALVGSARAWLHSVVGELWESAQAAEPIDAHRRAVASLAASNATKCSREAVELMYLAGGGTSNYLASPLQRCLRDIHAVSQHVVTAPSTWEQNGAVLVGGPLLNPVLTL